MPVFRYHGVDGWGAFLMGDYLEATDIEAAIAKCHDVLSRSSARFSRIEIWQDSALVHQTHAYDGPAHIPLLIASKDRACS
jgi:hypothetical protein